MKYIKNIRKKLFRLKKSRSISRSDDPSFSSGTSSDSSESQLGFNKKDGLATPTSVLPPSISNGTEWLDNYMADDLVHAFKLMDRDGDGKIKMEEMQALLSRVGAESLSQEEIQLMLSEVDIDGDGCISMEELSLIGSAFAPPACDDELKDTFDFFDADHDGKISAEELFNVFRTIVGDARCTLEECQRMIRGVDRDGDGFVCFQDFSRMMEQQLQR